MAEYEPIVGRYLKLDLGGRPHRLYVEEAGQGIPLVCLHTAGADNRQWRHLLNDAEITRHFRVLAFDMPWHGKSLPPVGLAGRGVPADHAGLHRSDPGLHPRAGPRASGRARLLDRRQDRAGAGASARGDVPRADRARVRRLPAALVRRHRLAAPARRPRRRGRRRDDVGADRAAEPERDALGHAVDVHDGRPRRLQGRSASSTGPTATSATASVRSIRRGVRSICSPASTTSRARPGHRAHRGKIRARA